MVCGTGTVPHHELLVEGLLGKVRTVWQLHGSMSASSPPAAGEGARILGAAGWEVACATDAAVAPCREQGPSIVQDAPAAGNGIAPWHR